MKIEPRSLQTNRMETPFIDAQPFFSWRLSSDDTEEQKQFCVEIDREGGETVWSSDWREGADNSIEVPDTCALEACTQYRWRLKILGQNGGADSAEAAFSTGKRGTPWKGIWITGAECTKPDEVKQAVYVRRAFCASKPRRAVLYIAGLGYFQASINGRRVGDDYFSTAYTAYDKRVLYRAYDVTELVEEGENAIGVVLGNGFYNCFTKDPWQTATAPWRAVPKLLCELQLDGPDGREVIASDARWDSVPGPIQFNGIRHGEVYDARLENPGWDLPGYANAAQPVRQTLDPGALLQLMEMEPIRVRQKYSPVRRWKSGDVWIYDIGQDISGIANITFYGPRGSTYIIRYSDRLNDDGSLNLDSLNSFIENYCFQTDTYTKGTDAPETWHASFAYYGMQYIEVTSPQEEPLGLEDIEAWALCNDFEDRGVFHTSDAVINGVQHMAVSSVTACCLNTMASDTVREKSSWTGDTGLTCEQMLYNFGAEQFFVKWMQDLRDSQRPGGSIPCIVPSPGWGYNSITGPDWCNPMYEVPWDVYMATGDIRALAENYDALLRHCAYMRAMAVDEIVKYGLGDWCAPFDGPSLYVNMTKFKCPLEVSDTAFRYAAVCAAERWAKALGRSQDEICLHAEAESIRAAFRKHFYDKQKNRVAGDCQSSTAMMLYYGFAEQDEIPGLVKRLSELIDAQNGHLDFGVLGMKSVLNVLGQYGLVKKALQMIAAPDYPSYRYWLDQGATTLWECWNGNGSHCHHMFSDVSAFFYKYIGGIIPTAPGYRKILLRPAIDCGIAEVECRVKTVLGTVECSHMAQEDGMAIHIAVPHGATATLVLPHEPDRVLTPGTYDFLTR